MSIPPVWPTPRQAPARRTGWTGWTGWIILAPVIATSLMVAFGGMIAAALAMCGVSGCGGGGFGRSTLPGVTLVILVASGIGAAAPWGWYAAYTRNRRLVLTTILVAVLTPVMAGLVIGADIHGGPRSISAQACAEDASPF